jgi:hypothetical protein
MKQFFPIIAILLSNHFSFGQGKFGVKIYQNTDMFSVKYYTDAGFSSSSESLSNKTNFTRASIALQITSKNKLTHEIEFMNPELSKSTDNPLFPFNYKLNITQLAYNSITTVSARYTVSKTVYSLNRLNFDLGIGINPYYVLQESISKIPTRYNSYLKYYGASFNVVPEVKFKLMLNLYLDLSVPFKIYDLNSEIFHVSNPSIPIDQQTISEKTSNSFFDKVYTIRIGILYAFAK